MQITRKSALNHRLPLPGRADEKETPKRLETFGATPVPLQMLDDDQVEPGTGVRPKHEINHSHPRCETERSPASSRAAE
jgi:hypothetical protein